jgi:hypothetical protein
MRVIQKIGEWLDERLQLAATLRETAEHPVPRETASWFYVFGNAALVVFMMQIITGILLAIIYVPSAGEAWNSLQMLNHSIALGWYIRALHGWGSNFMVAIVLIHMVQVFLFGFQISSRAHVDRRHLSSSDDLGNGVFWTSSSFRSGCVLGDWDRGVDREPRSDCGSVGCLPSSGRANHSARDTFALLCAARLCDSRDADCLYRPAPSDGAEARHQRMAYARAHCSEIHLYQGISRTRKKKTASPSFPALSIRIFSSLGGFS